MTTTDDRLERIFTVGQVAQSLSVTTITVYRMLSDGRLQGIKIGNRWRVRKQDVRRFMVAHTRGKR